MDAVRDKHNFVELEAHGLAVGLKEGLMGNSEVGSVEDKPSATTGLPSVTSTSEPVESSGRTLSRLTNVSFRVSRHSCT